MHYSDLLNCGMRNHSGEFAEVSDEQQEGENEMSGEEDGTVQDLFKKM